MQNKYPFIFHCFEIITKLFRQKRIDETLHNKSPGTSAEGFCLWAELELRSQIFKNTFKKIYEH